VNTPIRRKRAIDVHHLHYQILVREGVVNLLWLIASREANHLKEGIRNE
jgi:hypothetical protein